MKTWHLIVLIVAIVLVTIWASGGFKPAEEVVAPEPIPAVVKSDEKPIEVVEPEIKISDIEVKHLYDLSRFLIDGDPLVKNWKVQGAEMKYTCTTDNGVFVSMDPGVVNGTSTGDLGAVFYVACKKDGVVNLSTPYWSESALHNQIHLVELTDSLPKTKLIKVLKIFKIDEGKELAVYIDGEEVTKY